MITELAKLESIKSFCENKTIAIVGNSDRLLNRDYGSIIDSYDIVVRMNNAPSVYQKYSKFVGNKFDIYVACMTRLNIVKEIADKYNPKYTLILTGENVSSQVINLNIKNTYISSLENYRKVKSKFQSFKPSTGCLAIDFFTEYTKYKKIGLFGFDFFTSSERMKRNVFKSFLYKDHNSELERKYISSKIRDNVMIFH